MRFGVECDKGLVREINEDSYNIIAGYPGIPVSFIIADGMGGHNGGEIASKMAVELTGSYILQVSDGLPENGEKPDDETVLSFIEDIMHKVNLQVYMKSKENESTYGMGTTLILSMVYNKKLYIGHIGDSRVYSIRNGIIERLTVDHSYIEELVRNGSLTREEAERHPKKNLITRAIGASETIDVDKYIYEINDGDTFLLCTDGLTNKVSEEEILKIVESTDDPEAACNKLVCRANENGGEDNITVILFKC